MNAPLTAQELDLIVAALNYCSHCSLMFQDHLRYQGHEKTAEFAKENIDLLRQRVTSDLHQMLDPQPRKSQFSPLMAHPFVAAPNSTNCSTCNKKRSHKMHKAPRGGW